MRMVWAGLGLVATSACVEVPDDPEAAAWTEVEEDPILDAQGRPPNVLLVILDDVGPEMVDTYGLAEDAAPTPTFGALAEQGVQFTRAWALPWCSPTRAALATGLMPGRLGLGRAIELSRSVDEEWSLPDDAWTLPRALGASAAAYGTALTGKWHLSVWGVDAARGALRAGFDHHWGSVGNPQPNHASDGKGQNHLNWERVEDGVVSRSNVHTILSDFGDAATLMETLPSPWFVQVALRAAHFPYDQPPDDLHGYGNVAGNKPLATRAMVEASDRALGDLLDGMDPEVRAHTVVIVVGDNGTTNSARTGEYAPEGKGGGSKGGKSSVFEGGVRVPLVITGPGIEPGRQDDHLVHVVDLVPTVLDMAGVPRDTWPALDGVSLWPRLLDDSVPTGRTVMMAEAFAQFREANPPVDEAMWDGRTKWIHEAGGVRGAFEVGEIPQEGKATGDQAARDLRARLDDPERRYAPN